MKPAPFFFIIAAGLALAADWPRFRGPDGAGIAGDTLPPLSAESQRWKIDLRGPGNGSPVIVAGKIFLPVAAADGSDRSLDCFDAATGKKLWSKSVPGKRSHTHRKNTLASSTPAADGDRVVAIFWDGETLRLHAYSHDGAALWDRDLGSYKSEHGPGMSPVLFEGRVYVNIDQDGTARIAAFNARTGEPVWSADRTAHDAAYSTPFVRQVAGRAELIVTSSAGVTAYEPVRGDKLWEYVWDWAYLKNPLRTVGSSIVADGLILAYAGNGGGNSAVLALRPPESRAELPTLAWDKKKGFPYVPSYLCVGPHLFTVTDRGVAGCYIAKTGREVWTERLGGAFTASPVIAGEHIYAVSEDGNVFVYKAGPKFELLQKHPLGETVYASPAIADGRLFIRTQKSLWCFGK
ncbi:MAG: PQQ-like beta-propeller repeat protein [Gemmataceae bacterium]|nr:PQQ-like beta-propeller repeat protein [Gemmataceae bacterium]